MPPAPDSNVPSLRSELAQLLAAPGTGQPADRPDLHPDPDDLVVAVAAGLRALHQLPVEHGAGHLGAADITEWCRSAVAAGSVDTEQLPEPYRRYNPNQLLDMVIESAEATTTGTATTTGVAKTAGVAAADPELVVCHGRPTLDRLLIGNGEFLGFTDFDLVAVADRHLDLAVVHRSVQAVFGPEAVFRFYDAYGRDPHVARLEHYILVTHLLGLVGPDPGPQHLDDT